MGTPRGIDPVFAARLPRKVPLSWSRAGCRDATPVVQCAISDHGAIAIPTAAVFDDDVFKGS